MRGIALTTEKKQLKKAVLHREKYKTFTKKAKVHKKLEQTYLVNAKDSVKGVAKLREILSELYPIRIPLGTRQLLKLLKNEGYFPTSLCERDLVEALEKTYQKNNQAGWVLKTVEVKSLTVKKQTQKTLRPAHDFENDTIQLFTTNGDFFLWNKTLNLQVTRGASLAECYLVTGEATNSTINYINNRIGLRYNDYELIFNDANRLVAAKHL